MLVVFLGKDLNEFTWSEGKTFLKQIKFQLSKYSRMSSFVFPMVISSEFRKGQYKDDDHREDPLHFTMVLQ